MSPVRVVELPTPFRHQAEILNDAHPVKVPCLGRQAGKTLMGGDASLDGHGPRDGNWIPLYRGALHGASIYWVTKDYPTSTKIWRDIKSCLRSWGGELDKSEMERRIGFPGDGSLTIRSASDPDSLRGDTIDGLVGDEVAFWHPDALNTLRPALAVRRGWQLLISTPNGFDFFYDEWRKGDEHTDEDYASWQMPSSVNPAFSEEEFEKARARLNANVFAREYLAEFAVTDGSIFRRDWFRAFTQDEFYLCPDIGEKVAKASCQTFLAADFALTKQTYSDHTAIAVVSVAPDKRIFMRDLLRVKVSRAELVPMCKNLQERWGAAFVYCESSGELANLNEDMRKGGIRIRERKIHQKVDGKKGEDKVTRAYEASKAVELAKIFFLHNRQTNGSTAPAKWVGDLIAEACGFTGEPGRPDDQVDALSLSVLGVPFLAFRNPQPPRPPREDREDDGDDSYVIGRG
ncbi:terminase family protein [Candidatus Parcubacteria bacterium]|nr:terminase family protein [Candidatus Parcubacteria bacterium]